MTGIRKDVTSGNIHTAFNSCVPFSFRWVSTATNSGAYIYIYSTLPFNAHFTKPFCLLIGMVYHSGKRYSEAEESYQTALSLDPDHLLASDYLTKLRKMKK